MEENKTYRIRTKVGDDSDKVIQVKLDQHYDSFEILSLKIDQTNNYKTYESDYGVVVGRVLANGGFGIPNAKVSIFIESDGNDNLEDRILYPYKSPTSKNADGVRYNLLTDFLDKACYQNVGTFPNKRLVLDNDDVIDIFDKYYRYTTVTNNAGDYMIFGVPTGSQRMHVDIDLSDIGMLSQRPRDMIYKGYNIDLFDSPNKFKKDTNLNSLAQIISQDIGLYVYPYWGDTSDDSDNIAVTRADINIDYKFEPTCVFMGSIVTDTGSNAIGKNCTSTEKVGKMSELIAGEGSIEMIRKTIDGRVEEFQVKGNRVIDGDGVWCYQIPMNLDYIMTDEFGNIVPSDNPEKGIPTRTRVRFRISIDDAPEDNTARKRCRYLVPNNPRLDEELYPNFTKTKEVDYEFGTKTKNENYRDLLWNKVYTVKNYVPRLQKNRRYSDRRHTGIKLINHHEANNPMPYNNADIKLTFTYRMLCIIFKIFIAMVEFLNETLTLLSLAFCALYQIFHKIANFFKHDACFNIFGKRICPLGFIGTPFQWVADLFWAMVLPCIPISAEMCGENTTHRVTFFPGCGDLIFTNASVGAVGLSCITDKSCNSQMKKEDKAIKAGEMDESERTSCVFRKGKQELFNCIETALAEDNDVVSLNFQNDWVNGTLYAPMWFRKITKKKSYFFGLFKRRAKDQWCEGEKNYTRKILRIFNPCSPERPGKYSYKNYDDDTVSARYINFSDNKKYAKSCRSNCHKSTAAINLDKGLIVKRQTMLGQDVYYYKPVEYSSPQESLITNSDDFAVGEDGKNGSVKLLFATDIVLLGSLNDCDLHGVPQFFKSLESTTFNMPPNILFADNEVTVSITEDDGQVIYDVSEDSVSEMTGMDWGNYNEDLCGSWKESQDSGLFYSIGCSTIEMKPKSCVNMTRICEYGVSLDETVAIKNETEASSEFTPSDEQLFDTIVPDGFVSKDELYNDDERSLFATLNINGLRTERNYENGLMEYQFKHVVVDNFDKSLYASMADRQTKCNKTQRYNYVLEEFSKGYYDFRMGKKPYFYDKDGKLPRYENSFYFYFGLTAGKTALDKFNSQFTSDCNNDNDTLDVIGIDAVGNGWCNEMSCECNGYVKFDLSAIDLPCDIIISSQFDEFEIEINDNDDELFFIGNLDYISEHTITELEESGYVYKDITADCISCKCNNKFCMKNGTYSVTVTDNNGEIVNTSFVMMADFLSSYILGTDFDEAENVLLKQFKTYKNIAKNDDCLPQNTDVTINSSRGIGGTIAISTPFNSKTGEAICDFMLTISCPNINVEGYENGYNVAIKCHNWCDGNGEHKEGTVSPNPIELLRKNKDVFIFGVPKGDETYTVTITELCDGNLSNNVFVESVKIKQSDSFKLFVNGVVDYDVIKHWKCGFDCDSSMPNVTPVSSPKISDKWWHMSNRDNYLWFNYIPYMDIDRRIMELLRYYNNAIAAINADGYGAIYNSVKNSVYEGIRSHSINIGHFLLVTEVTITNPNDNEYKWTPSVNPEAQGGWERDLTGIVDYIQEENEKIELLTGEGGSIENAGLNYVNWNNGMEIPWAEYYILTDSEKGNYTDKTTYRLYQECRAKGYVSSSQEFRNKLENNSLVIYVSEDDCTIVTTPADYNAVEYELKNPEIYSEYFASPITQEAYNGLGYYNKSDYTDVITQGTYDSFEYYNSNTGEHITKTDYENLGYMYTQCDGYTITKEQYENNEFGFVKRDDPCVILTNAEYESLGYAKSDELPYDPNHLLDNSSFPPTVNQNDFEGLGYVYICNGAVVDYITKSDYDLGNFPYYAIGNKCNLASESEYESNPDNYGRLDGSDYITLGDYYDSEKYDYRPMRPSDFLPIQSLYSCIQCADYSQLKDLYELSDDENGYTEMSIKDVLGCWRDENDDDSANGNAEDLINSVFNSLYDINESIIEEINSVDELKTEFVDETKKAFQLNCGETPQNIFFTATTKNKPVIYHGVYKDEILDENTNLYKLDSKYTYTKEGSTIEVISIPTISYEDSVRFGNKDTNPNNGLKSYRLPLCYASDNIFNKSNKKFCNFIAVINSRNRRIPNDVEPLAKQDEICPDRAREVYKEIDLTKKFFGYHIIDKIFEVNHMTWACVDKVPYFKPLRKNSDCIDEDKAGVSMCMNGLFTGKLFNGNATNEEPYGGYKLFKTEFEQQTLGDEYTIEIFTGYDSTIETKEDVEDKMPTRRYIGNSSPNDGNKQYEQFRVTNSEDTAQETKDDNEMYTVAGLQKQYVPVVNDEMDMIIEDKNGCQLIQHIDGRMKIQLSDSSINLCSTSLKNRKKGCKLDVFTDNNGNATDVLYLVFSAYDSNNNVRYPLNLTEEQNVTYEREAEKSELTDIFSEFNDAVSGLTPGSDEYNEIVSQYNDKLSGYLVDDEHITITDELSDISDDDNNIVHQIDGNEYANLSDEEEKAKYEKITSTSCRKTKFDCRMTDGTKRFFSYENGKERNLFSFYNEAAGYNRYTILGKNIGDIRGVFGHQPTTTGLVSKMVVDSNNSEIKSYGYGNTGEFTFDRINGYSDAYYVIAITDRNQRAISPVYDFPYVCARLIFGIIYTKQETIDEDGAINGYEYVASPKATFDIANVIKENKCDDKPNKLPNLNCIKPEQVLYYFYYYPYDIQFVCDIDGTNTISGQYRHPAYRLNVNGEMGGYQLFDVDLATYDALYKTYKHSNQKVGKTIRSNTSIIATDYTGLKHDVDWRGCKQSDFTEEQGCGNPYAHKTWVQVTWIPNCGKWQRSEACNKFIDIEGGGCELDEDGEYVNDFFGTDSVYTKIFEVIPRSEYNSLGTESKKKYRYKPSDVGDLYKDGTPCGWADSYDSNTDVSDNEIILCYDNESDIEQLSMIYYALCGDDFVTVSWQDCFGDPIGSPSEMRPGVVISETEMNSKRPVTQSENAFKEWKFYKIVNGQMVEDASIIEYRTGVGYVVLPEYVGDCVDSDISEIVIKATCMQDLGSFVIDITNYIRWRSVHDCEADGINPRIVVFCGSVWDYDDQGYKTNIRSKLFTFNKVIQSNINGPASTSVSINLVAAFGAFCGYSIKFVGLYVDAPDFGMYNNNCYMAPIDTIDNGNYLNPGYYSCDTVNVFIDGEMNIENEILCDNSSDCSCYEDERRHHIDLTAIDYSNMHTITFSDSEDHSFIYKISTFFDGEMIVYTGTEPTKEGKKFNGWLNDENEAPGIAKGDDTFYAQWQNEPEPVDESVSFSVTNSMTGEDSPHPSKTSIEFNVMKPSGSVETFRKELEMGSLTVEGTLNILYAYDRITVSKVEALTQDSNWLAFGLGSTSDKFYYELYYGDENVTSSNRPYTTGDGESDKQIKVILHDDGNTPPETTVKVYFYNSLDDLINDAQPLDVLDADLTTHQIDVTQIPVASQEGKVFKCWAKRGESNEYTDDAFISLEFFQDTKFYAKYDMDKITVCFDFNLPDDVDGKDADGNPISPVIVCDDIDYGTAPTVPTKPRLNGWDFSAWGLGQDELTDEEVANTTLEVDTTYTASWVQASEMTYHVNWWVENYTDRMIQAVDVYLAFLVNGTEVTTQSRIQTGGGISTNGGHRWNSDLTTVRFPDGWTEMYAYSANIDNNSLVLGRDRLETSTGVRIGEGSNESITNVRNENYKKSYMGGERYIVVKLLGEPVPVTYTVTFNVTDTNHTFTRTVKTMNNVEENHVITAGEVPPDAQLLSYANNGQNGKYNPNYTWDAEPVGQAITESRAFNAIFEINKFTAEFIWIEGVSGSVVVTDIPYGNYVPSNRVPQASQAPSREGYTFIGWDKDPSTTEIIENTVFYGQWSEDEVQTWTVTFRIKDEDTNTTLYTYPQLTVDDGDVLAQSQIPTTQSILNNTGNPQAYEFDLWAYTNGGQVDFTLPIDANKFFNALVFKKSFIITFEHNNGTSDTTVVRGVDYGESVEMPSKPTYDGHNFLGWKYNSNTYQPGASYENVVSDMTFVGQWEEVAPTTYNVSFVHNNGTGTIKTFTYNEGSSVPMQPAPSYSGYSFDGWKCNANNSTYGVNETYQDIQSDLTFTAQWTVLPPNTHTVTFVFGLDQPNEVQTVIDGQSPVTPTYPSVTGYQFYQWDGDITQPIYSDKTFTASWKVKVEFTVNGGTIVGDAVQYLIMGSEYPSVPSVTANDGKRFKDKWTISGHTTQYTSEAISGWTFSEPHTFVAVIVDIYTVGFYVYNNGVETRIGGVHTVENGNTVTPPNDTAISNAISGTDMSRYSQSTPWRISNANGTFNTYADTYATSWFSSNGITSDMKFFLRTAYNVTFDFDQPTLENVTQTIEQGHHASVPTPGDVEDCTFTGNWDSSVSGLATDSSITANVTFTALWECGEPTVKHTVRFFDNDTLIETFLIEDGKTIAQSGNTIPSASGQNFIGWVYYRNGSRVGTKSASEVSSLTITTDCDFRAIYQKNYTITYKIKNELTKSCTADPRSCPEKLTLKFGYTLGSYEYTYDAGEITPPSRKSAKTLQFNIGNFDRLTVYEIMGYNENVIIGEADGWYFIEQGVKNFAYYKLAYEGDFSGTTYNPDDADGNVVLVIRILDAIEQDLT